MTDVYSIQDFKLMVKYDMNIIQDEADRLTFLASMYRRAGVLKSNYPEDLFDEGTTTMIKSDKLLDPDKTYSIGVWDMPVYLVDDCGEPVRNEDGTIAIFTIPNYDYSYLCDGVDIDELELRDEGDDYGS